MYAIKKFRLNFDKVGGLRIRGVSGVEKNPTCFQGDCGPIKPIYHSKELVFLGSLAACWPGIKSGTEPMIDFNDVLNRLTFWS